MSKGRHWKTYYRDPSVWSDRITQTIETESPLLNELRATLPGLTGQMRSTTPRQICSLCGNVPKNTYLLTLDGGQWRCVNGRACLRRQKQPHWIP